MPIASAYQREEPLAVACATEVETMPREPERVRRARRRLVRRRGDPDPADHDECERQQPDEEPVGERAGHQPAADLAVAIGDHVHDVDGAVLAAQLLGALLIRLRAGLELGDPAHQRYRFRCSQRIAKKPHAGGR